MAVNEPPASNIVASIVAESPVKEPLHITVSNNQADIVETQNPDNVHKFINNGSNTSKRKQTDNINEHDVKNIPVHFPRSVCTTSSSDFKGVVRKAKRVSRFYIGGIDKTCSSEESMRHFLSERNIHVTFLRYFHRPSKSTAAAQLNIHTEDEHLVKHPKFWPEGIFMKPWLPWEQFLNEHGSEPNNGRF